VSLGCDFYALQIFRGPLTFDPCSEIKIGLENMVGSELIEMKRNAKNFMFEDEGRVENFSAQWNEAQTIFSQS
jgi:hypothetical protein